MADVAAPSVSVKADAPVKLENGTSEAMPATEAGSSVKLSGDAAEGDDKKKTDPKAPKKYKAWDKDEMMLLRRGVQRHGVGNWEAIRQDPEFKLLQQRTGVQIKDKWRNLVKFRHLTEEEKQAIALRASKLNRRSAGRSSSFTFGPNPASSDTTQVQLGQQGGMGASGVEHCGQTSAYQGFSAYSHARDQRMKAEAELCNAQSACEHASAILDESMALAKQSAWSGDSTQMEGLLARANETMRYFMLCKQQAQTARDLETNVMKSLHLEPTLAGTLGCQSMPSSPVGGETQFREQKMRPNMALMYGRSQSYDPSTFSRLLAQDDTVGPAGMDGRKYPSFSDDGVGGELYGNDAAFGAAPGIPMIRTSAPKTRSPRRSGGTAQPGSPLGRIQRQGHGRNSPLARPAGLYGSYEQLPHSPMSQLSNQFDMQLGQQFLHNEAGSHSGYTSHNSMGDSGGAGGNSAGSATPMPPNADDCNAMYYGMDAQSPHLGTGRGAGDPGTSAFFSAEFSGISGQSGMQQAMQGVAVHRQSFGGGDMGTGMYQDMFSGLNMHGGMSTFACKTDTGGVASDELDLQMSEFANSATGNNAMSNTCSDVLLDCMEDMMGSDGLMGPIPNLD